MRGGLLDSAAVAAAANGCVHFCAGVGGISFFARSPQPEAWLAVVPGRFVRRVSAARLWFHDGGMDLRLALGILEQLGRGQMALHFSHVSADEDFRNARARLSGLPAVCDGMFRDVRYRGLAGGLAEEGEMTRARHGYLLPVMVAFVALHSPSTRAGGLAI